MTRGSGRVAIVDLRCQPGCIDVLADWYFTAWNHLEKLPRQTLVRELEDKLRDPTLGTTFVAIDNGAPIGTVSLDRSDLAGHEHLTPWLASLYVVPERRGIGLGKRLIAHVLGHAREAGHADVFLWTAGPDARYVSAGFRDIAQGILAGSRIRIMQAQVLTQPTSSGPRDLTRITPP